MGLISTEHLFTGLTTPITSYNPARTNLGYWIQQKTGINPTDKFAGPFPLNIARINESLYALTPTTINIINVGSNIHWVFLAETSGSSAIRVILCTNNTSTQAWSFRGIITISFASLASTLTMRGLQVRRTLYTTGTVAVSGTTVTGTSTLFTTNRLAVGGRIKFGNTDPNAEGTWYYVTAIASETSMTLNVTPGTISAGTSYVFEEIRIYIAVTGSVATNAGLFVAKGVNFDDFVAGGTTISQGSTTDNLKAVYWLGDAATNLNTASCGLAIGPTETNTNVDVYVLNQDTTTSLRIYKFNGRAALTALTAGRSTSAFLFRTGVQTVIGTISTTNNSCMATANHGPGIEISCLYPITTTRILRIPETSIVNASTNFIADTMVEISPGSTNTFPITSLMGHVEYLKSIDRFIIQTTAAARNYVTRYQTNVEQFDRVFTSTTNQQDVNGSNIGSTNYVIGNNGTFTFKEEDGILYHIKSTGQVGMCPFGADWDFASGTPVQRLISPEISTPNCDSFKRVIVNSAQFAGSESLGYQYEPYRVYARTSGITANTGSWTLLDDLGNLSSFSAASSIQIMFEFRVIGPYCIPARIYGFTVTYNDKNPLINYQPSVSLSNITSKRFAWRFSTAFGGTVPTLRIRLFNVSTGSSILDDTTVLSSSGAWERSTNGGSSWGSYTTSDKSNETTYIRYTPNNLADNIIVRALLTTV